jgi:hypothetical protein
MKNLLKIARTTTIRQFRLCLFQNETSSWNVLDVGPPLLTGISYTNPLTLYKLSSLRCHRL